MNEVRIYWLDARSEDGWIEQADLDMRVAKITTIGYIVGETKDVLCVASSRDACIAVSAESDCAAVL